LEQIVREPARGDIILDLCLTSHPSFIHQCKAVPGFSDHHARYCVAHLIPISQKRKCTTITEQTGFEEVNELSRHYYELKEQGQISVETEYMTIHPN